MKDTTSINWGLIAKKAATSDISLKEKVTACDEAVDKLIQKDLFSYNRYVEHGHAANSIVCDPDNNTKRECVSFVTNHYLGLNRHPEVIAASVRATKVYGTGTGTSAMAGGLIDSHHFLQNSLAEFVGKECAMLFTTGFTANFGFISALITKNDYVIFDKECHASLIEGILNTSAPFRSFKHNCLAKLEERLARATEKGFKNIFVIIESVYSLSGEEAPIEEICRLKQKYDFYLFVDEAHSFGIYGEYGQGLVHQKGCTNQVDFIMSTLSKTTASLGGFVACDKRYINYLRVISRPFMFQATLPPSSTSAAQKALEVLSTDNSYRLKLWKNNAYLRQALLEKGFNLGESTSPIIPVYVSDHEKLQDLCRELLNNGVFTTVIAYPAVGSTEGRLRFIVTSSHTTEQLDFAADAMTNVALELGILKSNET
ncbi:aminotransferase class I/II-fold pyridoxal phosphate-dependent enzyme [Moritella sp. 36]|uniref:aminotransferase class I/II-fold pyridoxal phosphate-dependent enzyme n=1 Tax=Moritella sp. 36 TaxID=2746233 RepID=UPI001BA8369D|nr:aminotransferase class I/II-fold pyridoxal phosphate-dependent enzyme [Moritella sp. 36]QUM88816.1 aminotransferase class I/II-fold pyridoxal phosphate-dependent enzyme [Moritella sp. 36]